MDEFEEGRMEFLNHPDFESAKELADQFQRRLGRPLRVAHVGNIANNAYLAAKAERLAGIDAYALSPSYSHVMGFPSWEETCETCPVGGHFSGDIAPDVAPEWFLSGSWREIVDALGEVRGQHSWMSQARNTATKAVDGMYERYRERLLTVLSRKAQDWIANNPLFSVRYRLSLGYASQLASQFDLVNAYGPYNAYFPEFGHKLLSTEHGTLRDFVWADTVMSRLSLEGYRRSRVVLVTNQDNLEAARALSGATKGQVVAMPHPTNPNSPACQAQRLPSSVERILMSGRCVVLSPTRHSTTSTLDRGKGSSILYDTIAEASRLQLPVSFLLVEWGDAVDHARARLAVFEENGLVGWLPLLTRPALQGVMTRVTAVADQFVIPAYGAIGLDALALGKPLMSRSDPALDRAFFGAPAPVLDTMSRETFLSGLQRVADCQRSRTSISDGGAWYADQASWPVSLLRRLEAYRLAT